MSTLKLAFSSDSTRAHFAREFKHHLLPFATDKTASLVKPSTQRFFMSALSCHLHISEALFRPFLEVIESSLLIGGESSILLRLLPAKERVLQPHFSGHFAQG